MFIYKPISFELGMTIETTNLNIFYINLVDLHLHSKSQLYDKSKTSLSIFLEISVDLDEIQSVATTCWFVESHAKCMVHK